MNNDRRRYSVIPIRAVGLVKRGEHWRVLAALCSYTSPSGVAYPNQTTLGEMCQMGQPHVSRAIRELHRLGLVRLLRPKGKKHKRAFMRGNRYQVLYDPNAPLPSPLETEIAWNSRTNRWPSHQDRGGTEG